jgi:uncharacterized protein YecE (DUF72 family)
LSRCAASAKLIAKGPPLQLFAGTSGFAYREWIGPFYPEGLPAAQMLRFYAGRLPAVEINNTFYRMPNPALLESWAAQVPEGFRFVLKASQRITHRKRLRDVGEETAYLLRTAAALGRKLGPILFQLPPNLGLDLERLDRFLELLPPGTRAALEFRHPAWRDPAVHERLRARDVALVTVDAEDGPGECEPATAGFGYLRLRRPGYAREELADWVNRIATAGFGEVFVFFKHEDAGAGPRLAEEFLALAARTAERKPAKPALPAEPVRPAARAKRGSRGVA